MNADSAPEGRCPDCRHRWDYHGPRSGCLYPESHDGPACGCTRPPTRKREQVRKEWALLKRNPFSDCFLCDRPLSDEHVCPPSTTTPKGIVRSPSLIASLTTEIKIDGRLVRPKNWLEETR